MTHSLTSEQFLELVAKSGLVEASALTGLESRVRDQLDGELPQKAERLADLLIRKDMLTTWHVEKLFTWFPKASSVCNSQHNVVLSCLWRFSAGFLLLFC